MLRKIKNKYYSLNCKKHTLSAYFAVKTYNLLNKNKKRGLL